MKIIFGDQRFILHAFGALIWVDQHMLIVADLHLEKSSHYAQRGYFLPPYDSHATLSCLYKILAESKCSNLMILGDCFHDAKGYERLGSEERKLFDGLLSYNPLWIVGNHDEGFVPDGFVPYDAYIVEKLVFRHEANPAGKDFEISGHFHPKIDIFYKKDRITRPCFVETENKLILPASGAYTGGLSVTDPAFRRLWTEPPRFHILGNNKIYTHSLKETI